MRLSALPYLAILCVPAVLAMSVANAPARHVWHPQQATHSVDNALYNQDWSDAVDSSDAVAQATAFLMTHEGYMAHTYICAGGYATIGYGHRVQPGEYYTVLSPIAAGALLAQDLLSINRAITPMLHVRLTENEKAAVLSFVYNVGVSAFAKSTLLHKLNAGDGYGVLNEFAKWVKAHNKTLPGLKSRRNDEIQLFYASR